MKKLLTVLLTLVMAICLINLNNSHTNAEETNDDSHANCTTGTCTIDDGLVFDGSNLSYAGGGTPRTDMIEYADGVITIKQNITINAVNKDLLKLNEDATIKLTKDISLTGTNGNNAQTLTAGNTKNITIDGEYHKLTINQSADKSALQCNKLTTNNLILDITNSGNNAAIYFSDLLELNNTKMKLVSSGGGSAIYTDRTSAPEPATVGTVKGCRNTLWPLTDATWGNDFGYYSYYEGGYQCVVLEINEPDVPFPVDPPTPSPSQPKDESCEKVIGPTWHWNNDKGVCEEYATVGTYTR